MPRIVLIHRRAVAVWGGVLLVVAGIAATALALRPSALERARRAAETGRRKEAAALYEEHLRRLPDDHAARIELGDLYLADNPRRALSLFTAVPEGAIAFASAQRRIAAIEMTTGNDGLAEKTLQNLVARDPDDFAVRLSLAELYHRQKRPKDALPQALRCVELKPGRVQNWMLLAEIYDDLHRTHEMIAPLQRALELDPDLMDAHLNLCYALVWSGMLTEGRQEAEWCLSRDDENVAARRLLAQCERDEGHPEQALNEIRRALRTAPDDLECRLVEAQLLLFLKKADEAYRRLHALEPRQGEMRRYLELIARAAAASARPQEAAAYRKRAEETADPDNSRHSTE